MAIEPWQRIQILDTRTGEVVTETSNPNAGVYLGKRRKHPGGFVIVYESEFRQAALLLKPYGALPICLWNILFTKVEIGTGEILVDTTELAEMLQTHRPNVSKAVKTLVDLGLIRHVGDETESKKKDGRHYKYQMNPAIMWKGKETERQNLIQILQGGKTKKKEK